VFYFLLLASATGLGVGWWQDRKEVEWGRGLVMASTGLLVVLALWSLFMRGPEEASVARRMGRSSITYAGVAGEKLGRHLASKHEGATALVILPLPHRLSDLENIALIAGLKQGLEGAIEVADWHQLPLPTPYRKAGAEITATTLSKTPVDGLFTAKYFDELVARYAGRCDLVISLAALPIQGAIDMRLWDLAQRPRVAVFSDNRSRLKLLLEAGKIDIAVFPKEKAHMGVGPVSADLDEAFGRRYELHAR